MNAAVGWAIEIAILAGIYVLALILSFPLRPRQPRPESGTGVVTFRFLFQRMALPVAVLGITFCLWWAALQHPSARAWVEAYGSHVKVWAIFWLLLLILNLIEELGVQFFALCKRTFPIPSLLRNIIRGLIVLGAVFALLKYGLNVNISPLLASTALVTAVVGFALQGVLGNLLAGMSLHLTRSIIPGDWVAIDTDEGEVIEANWRETRLRTVGGHIIMIPNSRVASAVVRNMSRPDRLRRHTISVGASYSDAPGEVIAALLDAAESVPQVLPEPRPSAVVTEFKDFGVNYELRFWSETYHDRKVIEGEVNRMVWYRFKRRGIEIPFPMSDKLLNDFMEVVYTQRRLQSDEEEVRCRVRDILNSDFAKRLLVNETGEFLLSEKELTEVARLMRRVRYTRGETIFKQGDQGDNCFILIKGKVKGVVDYEGKGPANEFELQPGALLGEMSLMTDLPRTATLTAREEVDMLEIRQNAFVHLLSLRKEVPEVLARLVSERAGENREAFAHLKALESVKLSETLEPDSLLKRFLRLLSGGL